ncbi:MAG: peroxiredoxin [Brumimicrobium sp.]
MAIKKGDKCPQFELKNQSGEMFDISTLLGKKMFILYFYPKDDSPGCTKQACSFRDAYEDFLEIGAEVIGISSDDEDDHKSFAKKHNLPFILLADTKKEVRKKFGVPTNLLGLIPGRVTYIIDQNGVVQGVFNSQLNFDKHVTEAIKILKELKKE